MALSYDYTNKRIGVSQADAQPILMQTLINSIRAQEASEAGIVMDQIATASGKDVLASGVTVGITVALLSSWTLNFSAGAYQATVTGGNLADALARIYNTGSPQVLINSSAAATMVATSGSTAPSAGENAAAVLAAMNTTPPGVNVKKVNGAEAIGDGTEANKWRAVGVPN